jgi:hypothetical protein
MVITLFHFWACFTLICSTISVHVFQLGAKGNLSGKALKPCIDAIAASKLHLAEWSTLMVARDDSNELGCYRVAHVLDNSIISLVNSIYVLLGRMSWGSLKT